MGRQPERSTGTSPPTTGGTRHGTSRASGNGGSTARRCSRRRCVCPTATSCSASTAVADGGGLTVVEIENASPLPFAVAFSHGAPADDPASDRRADRGHRAARRHAVVVPVGHRSVVRIAIAHDGRGAGRRPGRCRPPTRWRGAGSPKPRPACASRASTTWPTTSWPPGRPCCWRGHRRPTTLFAFLLGLTELVRLGQPAAPWVVDVAEAAAALARQARRRGSPSWDEVAALDGAAEILRPRASPERSPTSPRSVARLGLAEPPPEEPPDGVRFVAWLVRRLAVPTPAGADLVPRLPRAWRGRNLALYGLPVPRGVVSFALRWHGDRPALLWDVTGDVELRAPGLDATWSTSAASGEALLAAPPP